MNNFVFLFALFFVTNTFGQNSGPKKFVPNVPAMPSTPAAQAAPGQTQLPPTPGAPQPVAMPQQQQQQQPQQQPVQPVISAAPGSPATAPADATATAAAPVAPMNPMMTDPLLEGFFEDLQYNPADKRDPFLPYFAIQKQKLALGDSTPLEPLQQFALNDLKVIGIIWDVGHPKALIIDPGGKSHIIVENTKLGKEFGYVAAIREGEIIVVEPIQDVEGKKGYQTKILKLTKQ
jgi:type IV pilus assembly protein PilP